jgi:hypothetical protein
LMRNRWHLTTWNRYFQLKICVKPCICNAYIPGPYSGTSRPYFCWVRSMHFSRHMHTSSRFS